MSTIEINSIETLLKVIQSVRDANSGKQLFFRGQQKKFEQVIPLIGRDGYLDNEDKLFKEYILRNPDEFIGERTTFEKLVKMQHYKLPTRLLDISTNPLVALFFAVENDEKFNDSDGDFIIYAVPEEKIKYYDSDTVSVIANIARRPIGRLNIETEFRKPGESLDEWVDRFNKKALCEIQWVPHS